MKHFHSVFNYCPSCGDSVFRYNDEKSKKCGKCGFVYYFNASAASAAFITNEKGELLVCRRAKNPAKGTLDLPGGFVDAAETIEEAIAREIKEELNLEVKSLNYLFSLPNEYLYSGLIIPTVDMFFEAKVITFNNLKADDDVDSVTFLPIENLDPSQFGLSSIREAVKRWKNNKLTIKPY